MMVIVIVAIFNFLNYYKYIKMHSEYYASSSPYRPPHSSIRTRFKHTASMILNHKNHNSYSPEERESYSKESE